MKIKPIFSADHFIHPIRGYDMNSGNADWANRIGTMELLCGKCGNTLNVVWDQAGQDIRCPHCGNTIHIPAMDASVPTHDEDGFGAPAEDDFLTKARLLLQRKLLVICGSCGERLTVEQRLAGKTLRCPACGGQIRIPHQADEDDFPDVSTRMDVLDITEEPEPSPIESDAYLSAESDKNRSRSKWPVAIVLILMTGLAGIAIGYILRGRGGGGVPEEKPPTSTAPARREQVPTTKPTVTTLPVVAATMPVTPPVKAKAAMKVRRVKTAILADGLVPAPLGRMFLYVKVDVIASEDALSINVTGGDVVLESDAGKIAPLGLALTGSIVPLVARGGTIVVKPLAGRIETFVFVVPEEFDEGKLKIAGIGECELPALPAFSAPDPSAIVGTYAEAGRYLRVAFKNPIMERLRAGPVHGLVISKQGERLTIAFPTTGLRGLVHSANVGTYAVILTDGKTHLQCHLRLIDSGKRLILYLSEKPYHQIIYEKK